MVGADDDVAVHGFVGGEEFLGAEVLEGGHDLGLGEKELGLPGGGAFRDSDGAGAFAFLEDEGSDDVDDDFASQMVADLFQEGFLGVVGDGEEDDVASAGGVGVFGGGDGGVGGEGAELLGGGVGFGGVAGAEGDGVAGEGESEGEAAAFGAGAAEEGEHGDLLDRIFQRTR